LSYGKAYHIINNLRIFWYLWYAQWHHEENIFKKSSDALC